MPAHLVLVAVLAGGRSRRMGTAKALVEFHGVPLIAHPLAAAAVAGLPAFVVAKAGSPLPPLRVPVWEEPAEPVHPLTGVIAALERAGDRHVIAVACDQPFVSPAMLGALAGADLGSDGCAAAFAHRDGTLEPFPACYTAAALPTLRGALADQAPLRATLAALRPVRLALPPGGDGLLMSLNTPEALAAAS